MQTDTTARLIAVSYSGELGAVNRVETPTDIFCQISSIDRREYYAAYNSGFRPDWRVTTDPINYAGQGIIELDTPEGAIRCDIYRTYRKAQDVLELWCVRKNEAAVQIVTLWTAGKRVKLFGAYLSGTDGQERTETGKVATDTVTLILPRDLQAYVSTQLVAYCRPKEYARMSDGDKAEHFCIGSDAFFALGDIDPALLFSPKYHDGVLSEDGKLFAASDIAENAKFQQVNAVWDDVYRVKAVAWKNGGKPDSEYLEVIGK